MNLLRLSCFLMASVLGFLLCTVACYSETNLVSDSKPLAFSDVNESVLENYAHAKDEIRQSLGPIIICTSDSVSLLKGKDKTTIVFISPRYTGLKQIAHITLGAFVLLANHTDRKLSTETIDRLAKFRASIEKAAPRIKEEEGLQPGDQSRQQEIINMTLSFLSTAIDEKRVSHDNLLKYAHSCAEQDLENAYEAAGSQITAIDDAINTWHKEMTAEEWNKLHVIIWTTHMPRQDLLSYQYFARLLNQTAEGSQIIVAESASPGDDEQAIDLLLTHILDKKIAEEFFQDQWRMHRDLLSDGAKEWLEKHQIKANLPK